MDNQKVVIAILILAILFSAIATVMSLSILDFKPVFVQKQQTIKSAEGNNEAGVNVGIEPYVPGEVLQ
jgi:hypothetical protein